MNTSNEQKFERIFDECKGIVEIKPILNVTGSQIIQYVLPCGCIQIDQYTMDLSYTQTNLTKILFDDNRTEEYQFCTKHKEI